MMRDSRRLCRLAMLWRGVDVGVAGRIREGRRGGG
jgi:hypothetical protein